MDLIYIILISIAVVSFIVGFIIDTIQKKYSKEVINEVENNDNSIHNGFEKTLDLVNTLNVKVNNNISVSVTNDEPVIISSVMLGSYDDEIL